MLVTIFGVSCVFTFVVLNMEVDRTRWHGGCNRNSVHIWEF